MAEIPLPNAIYCPKCGQPIELKKIEEARTNAKLEEGGYAIGARGDCTPDCGVTAVLAIKRMPENPTFTLMFNIYKLDIKSRGRNHVS